MAELAAAAMTSEEGPEFKLFFGKPSLRILWIEAVLAATISGSNALLR
jgi:hypothetical protein